MIEKAHRLHVRHIDTYDTEEGGAPLFFNTEEVMAGADPAAREAMLARLDGMLDEGDFDDEVDEEEDALYEDADEDEQPAANGR